MVCLIGMLGLWSAEAHSVPNLTVDAVFEADGSYLVAVNIDPRLFLAEVPTSLPPIAASWWLDQTPDQQKATHEQAVAYLKKSLELRFGELGLAAPEFSIVPLNGVDGMPFTPATTEVHLLATVKGKVPGGQADFSFKLLPAANAATVLLLSKSGKAEPRPQVIFPGETSRSVKVP
jgi:hypothetical protein